MTCDRLQNNGMRSTEVSCHHADALVLALLFVVTLFHSSTTSATSLPPYSVSVVHVRPRGCPLPPPTSTFGDDAFHCNLRPPHANPSPNSIEDSLCTSQVGCTHPQAPTVPSSKQHAVRRRRRVEFGQQSTQSSHAHLTSPNGPHSTIPLPLTFPRPSTLANVAAAQKSASLLPLPTPLPPLSSVLG